jgi:hypothetical protein
MNMNMNTMNMKYSPFVFYQTSSLIGQFKFNRKELKPIKIPQSQRGVGALSASVCSAVRSVHYAYTALQRNLVCIAHCTLHDAYAITPHRIALADRPLTASLQLQRPAAATLPPAVLSHSK